MNIFRTSPPSRPLNPLYVLYQHFEIDTTHKNKMCNYLSVHKEYTSQSENKVFL